MNKLGRFIIGSKNMLEEVLIFLQELLTPRRFLLFAGILVGLSSALAAVVLKWTAHQIHSFLFYGDSIPLQEYAFIFLPVVGLLLTVWIGIRLFGGMPAGGIGRVLTAISTGRSNLNFALSYAHIIGAALTVGFGGSCGLESPIVTTGSAIGSNFGRRYKLSYREKTLLIACGASAGISAAFNAPVAGVLFSIEVLLTDVAISAFIPLLLSAGTGVILSHLLLGSEVLLFFPDTPGFSYINTPFYILLGAFTGFYGHYYSNMFRLTEKSLKKEKNVWKRVLLGGLALAVIFALFPPLFGEGYDSVKKLAAETPEILLQKSLIPFHSSKTWWIYLFLATLLLLKPFATGITLGAGGVGGNFAPSMFTGALSGFLFSRLGNLIPGVHLPTENFALTGMAGMLCGIFRSPLTAIFLVQEITGGYTLIIPLMLTVATGYAVSGYLKPYAMELHHLAMKGKIFTENKDRNALFSIPAAKLVKDAELCIHLGDTATQALERHLRFPKTDVVPLLSNDGAYMGSYKIATLRGLQPDEPVENYEPDHILFIKPDETGKDLMNLFEKTDTDSMPCCKDGKYLGMVYKLDVMLEYRAFIQSVSLQI